MIIRRLLMDGSLAVVVDPAVWDAVEPWIPRFPEAAAEGTEARARLRVVPGAAEDAPPGSRPDIDLRGVLGWVLPGGVIRLHGPGGGVTGSIDPARGDAEIRLLLDRANDDQGSVELAAALTLASAFLLGRLGRTLVHAGAVVAADGRAWLLVGGTFSGKTTTCLNLIRSGLDYLSDDHVVLGGDEGGLRVEGWPRRFNLDLGYGSGESQGVRRRMDPSGFGPGRCRAAAVLGGLLFPRVDAGADTAARAAHPARALARLLQQSPWLLADRVAAPSLLSLLREAARKPGFDLCLGLDCYADPARLRAVLAPIMDGIVGAGRS